MRLCFDATKFGCGLDGAIELAADKGISAVEYSFLPFETSGKNGQSIDKKEKTYFQKVKKIADAKAVEIDCIVLDSCLEPGDPKNSKQFLQMVQKLSKVGEIIGAKKLSISVNPGPGDQWKELVEGELKEFCHVVSESGIKPLLRLATPSSLRGRSLRGWRALEPQDWRDMLSSCDGLSLSYSPADCLWLGIDYLRMLSGFTKALEHVEVHDVEVNRDLLGDSGIFGPLWWRYRIPGKGQVDWRQLIEALKLYDFQGTFSIHLDDEFVADNTEDLNDALDASIKLFAPLMKG